MPEFVEASVLELVESFTSGAESQKAQILSVVSPQLSSLLGWYARKLAGRAVRDKSRKDLRDGLIALVIAANETDFRDIMAPLALLHNSALLLHEDPQVLFEEAANATTRTVRNFLEQFASKPAKLKSIQAYGFEEGTGPLGFDYVPLLPEYGGSTPL